MKRDDRKPDPDDYLQPTGAGAPLVPPADNSLFVPDDVPEDDDQGVNEEDILPEDEGLLGAGASPEFDHSLRKRKTESDH